MPDISEENGVQCSFEFSSLVHTIETQLSPADQERGTCTRTCMYYMYICMCMLGISWAGVRTMYMYMYM